MHKTQGRDSVCDDLGERRFCMPIFCTTSGPSLEQLWVDDSIAYKSLFDVFGRRIYSARYSKGELFSELKHQYDAWGRYRFRHLQWARDVAGRVANDYDDRGRRVRATTEAFGQDQQQKWITTYEAMTWATGPKN